MDLNIWKCFPMIFYLGYPNCLKQKYHTSYDAMMRKRVLCVTYFILMKKKQGSC